MDTKHDQGILLSLTQEKPNPTLFLGLIQEYKFHIEKEVWFLSEVEKEFLISLLKIANNSKCNLLHQCESILDKIFQIQYFYLSQKASLQKFFAIGRTLNLEVDVLITYLLVGGPKQNDYESLIEFLYEEKRRYHFPESSIEQALIISLLEIKAHKIKTIEEISSYTVRP